MGAWVRTGHRWLSMLFTLTVLACFAGLALGEPPAWLFYLPLPPLFLLMGTGLWLFAGPHLRGSPVVGCPPTRVRPPAPRAPGAPSP